MDDEQDGAASFAATLIPFAAAVVTSAGVVGLIALFGGVQSQGQSAPRLMVTALFVGAAAGASVCPLFALVPPAREPHWWMAALCGASIAFIEYFFIFGGDTTPALRCALAGAVGGATYSLVMGQGRAARRRAARSRRAGR